MYAVPGFLITPANGSRAGYVGNRPGAELRWQANRHLWFQETTASFLPAHSSSKQDLVATLIIGPSGRTTNSRKLRTNGIIANVINQEQRRAATAIGDPKKAVVAMFFGAALGGALIYATRSQRPCGLRPQSPPCAVQRCSLCGTSDKL